MTTISPSFKNFESNPERYVLRVKTTKDSIGKLSQVVVAESKFNLLTLLCIHIFSRSSYKMENILPALQNADLTPGQKSVLSTRFFQEGSHWKAKNLLLACKFSSILFSKGPLKQESKEPPSPLNNVETKKFTEIQQNPGNIPKIETSVLPALQKYILKGQKLPEGSGSSKMTGEEHIAAILYDQLIDQAKRSDCAILLKPTGNSVLPDAFDVKAYESFRFLIIPMSVNNNTHNTVLVVDQEDKVYAYFDSLGGTMPDEAKQELQNKHVNPDEIYAEEIGLAQTKQKDGWSCGFHAVENVLVYVNQGTLEDRSPTGDSLRAKYAPAFERFSANHCKTEDIFHDERLCRRQKMRLRDGIEKAIADVTNHPLKDLYESLKTELGPDSPQRERPLTAFMEEYLKQHPADAKGIEVLTATLNPQGPLYQHMPKKLEGENVKSQEEGISEALKTLLL